MRRRRHRFGPAALALSLMLAAALPAAASIRDEVEPAGPTPWDAAGTSDSEFVDDLWFVEFAAPPSARGGNPAAHANERARFQAEARADGVHPDQERDFTTLWNGVTVRADLDQIATIGQLRSVSAVYPVAIIDTPEPEDVSPALSTALTMTGADVAQSELGYTGDGLSVAIVDTGIDYNHPDLGGDGEPTNVIDAGPDRTMDHPRITHGFDYVGDEFDAGDPDTPPPAPNDNPMDLHGHGTHVAGIVGASAATDDGVTGVAPGVTFGAYKVFATGSTTADIIVDALEDAFVDGMDIVNMSLGAAFVWGQEYPTTQVSNELANQGVAVVNSAGNSGADGAWTLSAPANGHDIISVASADNTFFDASSFEVAQFEDPIPWLPMTGADQPPMEGGSDEVAWIGRACAPDPIFTGDPDELLDDPEGKTALIIRGDCQFDTKYTRAVEAGATGVVIYNQMPGFFAGTVGDAGVDGVWSVGINDTDGAALVDLIEGGETVTLEFTDELVTAPNPTGGLVSGFSSYGQDVELAFGPTIMAPGGLITSTWLLDAGSYATISGTSMSAPHVAGTVALLWEAEPDLDPFETRDRLQNTAEPANWSLNPGLGLADHTFRQGAGMVQIDRAILADQAVTPAQVAMGDADEVDVTLTLTNRGADDVTYTVGHVPALEVAGSTFTPGFFLFGSDVDAPDTVTVPAGGAAEVAVSITSPNSGAANHQFGGYVTFTSEDEGASTLRVPYAGFDGDYADEMGLLGYWDSPTEFVDVDPFLSRIEDGELVPVDEGYTYTLRTGDIPVIEPFFGHSPRTMEVWAVNQDDGERLLAIEDEYLRRSAAVGTTRPVAWSGMVAAGGSSNARPAPSGTYVFELRVLRALGDPGNDDHWDTWTSPEFVLDSRRGGPPAGRGPNR